MISLNKERIGAIGECMVISKLLQHNWDAINANLSIRNCSAVDIICLKDKETTKLIQVKTTLQKTVPTGFDLQSANKNNLENKVVGPWVFVFADDTKGDMTFRYFILSRKQVIEFISKTNEWYLNWDRKNAIKMTNLCCLDIRWFINKNYDDGKHQILNKILDEDPENNWENIWKE